MAQQSVNGGVEIRRSIERMKDFTDVEVVCPRRLGALRTFDGGGLIKIGLRQLRPKKTIAVFSVVLGAI